MSDGKAATWRVVIPNALTVLRLLAAVLFPLAGHGGRIALLLYAGISDLVDGEISRRLGATSKFGKTLDPIADKAVVLSVAGTFLWEGSVDWWQLMLVASRDMIVLALTVIVAWQRLRQPIETSPLLIGKVATAGQFVYLWTVLLIPQAYTLVFIASASISCIAGAAYLQDTFAQVRNLQSS